MKRILNVNKKTNQIFRSILFITIVYIIIHGFMLLLTGTFHDDWTSFFHDTVTKDMEGMESGRPYYSMLIELIWKLPGYSYRFLSFFTYYFYYLFMYGFFKNVKIFNNTSALLISVLCMALPFNDARVILANYPYAFGLLLFAIASYVLILNIYLLNKRFLIRLIILVLYFCSFTLNSNLVLYGCVILLVFLKNKKIVAYLDLYLLPIIFYVLNKLLFPVYGNYANYNSVTLKGLFQAIIKLPLNIISSGVSIVKNYSMDLSELFSDALKNLVYWSLILAFIVGTIFIIIAALIRLKKNKIHDWKGFSENKCLLCSLAFGFLLLICGIFPYLVVRQGSAIQTTGVGGRDSIQLALGVSVIVVGIIDYIKKRNVKMLVLFASVVFGAFHFNIWYLNYQSEWYKQVVFQDGIEETLEISNGGNYLVNVVYPSKVGDSRFYTWTGNTVSVTNNQNVFMMNGESDLYLLNNQEEKNKILTHYPMFNNYRANDNALSGSVKLDCNISITQTIELKFYELFDSKSFDNCISSIGYVSFTPQKETRTINQ